MHGFSLQQRVTEKALVRNVSQISEINYQQFTVMERKDWRLSLSMAIQ